MPPVDLGAGAGGRRGRAGRPPPAAPGLVARSSSGSDRRSRARAGSGTGARPRPLRLPPDWPAERDRRRVAAGRAGPRRRGRATGPGWRRQGIFVVGELGAARTRVIPIRGDYDRLEGWWSHDRAAGRARDLHGGLSGPVRLFRSRSASATARVTPFTAADRARGPIDDVPGRPGGIVMTGDQRRRARRHPRSTGRRTRARSDGPDLVAFAPDRRSLLVTERDRCRDGPLVGRRSRSPRGRRSGRGSVAGRSSATSLDAAS